MFSFRVYSKAIKLYTYEYYTILCNKITNNVVTKDKLIQLWFNKRRKAIAIIKTTENGRKMLMFL